MTQQHAFSKSLGTRVLRLLLGEGLLTSEDPLHRQMRRIVQPAFHHERMVEYARIMQRDASEFVDRIDPQRPFDARAAMTALTLRIATETLFGSDESESARVVAEALHLMMREFPYMLTPLSGLRQRLPLPGTRRFWHSRAMLDEIIYGLIARRRRDGGDRGDALSMLLAARDAETGHRPTDEQIRDEIMTLFIAGHETTANAMTWALVLLARNPEVDARAAVAAAQGDRDYLDRLVKEILRLYPPAWIIGRETRSDVTLADGTRVARGMTVFMAPLILHRQAEYFEDPERFDPQRWTGEDPAAVFVRAVRRRRAPLHRRRVRAQRDADRSRAAVAKVPLYVRRRFERPDLCIGYAAPGRPGADARGPARTIVSRCADMTRRFAGRNHRSRSTFAASSFR